MKIEAQAKTVATVERERERESYSLFNVEFVYSTTPYSYKQNWWTVWRESYTLEK